MKTPTCNEPLLTGPIPSYLVPRCEFEPGHEGGHGIYGRTGPALTDCHIPEGPGHGVYIESVSDTSTTMYTTTESGISFACRRCGDPLPVTRNEPTREVSPGEWRGGQIWFGACRRCGPGVGPDHFSDNFNPPDIPELSVSVLAPE